MEDLVGGVELGGGDGVVVVGVDELEPGLNLGVLQLPEGSKQNMATLVKSVSSLLRGYSCCGSSVH